MSLRLYFQTSRAIIRTAHIYFAHAASNVQHWQGQSFCRVSLNDWLSWYSDKAAEQTAIVWCFRTKEFTELRPLCRKCSSVFDALGVTLNMQRGQML